jgi:hypothetical protein
VKKKGELMAKDIKDKEEVWQKGIEPHIHVEPTIEDVIRNKDRTLETAPSYLR